MSSFASTEALSHAFSDSRRSYLIVWALLGTFAAWLFCWHLVYGPYSKDQVVLNVNAVSALQKQLEYNILSRQPLLTSVDLPALKGVSKTLQNVAVSDTGVITLTMQFSDFAPFDTLRPLFPLYTVLLVPEKASTAAISWSCRSESSPPTNPPAPHGTLPSYLSPSLCGPNPLPTPRAYQPAL